MKKESPTDIHLVFSRAPDGVTVDEFNKWYDRHVHEILRIPGFRSARRFELEPVSETAGREHRFVAIYEFDHGIDVVGGIMQARDSGGMDLPGWFPRFESEKCFTSWNGIALGTRVEREAGGQA